MATGIPYQVATRRLASVPRRLSVLIVCAKAEFRRQQAPGSGDVGVVCVCERARSREPREERCWAVKDEK